MIQFISSDLLFSDSGIFGHFALLLRSQNDANSFQELKLNGIFIRFNFGSHIFLFFKLKLELNELNNVRQPTLFCSF